MHEENKPYKCNASFTQKASLKGNIESVHEGKKHSNVTFVIRNLLKNLLLKIILHQFINKQNIFLGKKG